MEMPSEDNIEAHNLLRAGVEHCHGRNFVLALDQFQGAFIAYRESGDRRSASLVQQTIAQVIGGIKDPKTVREAFGRACGLLRQAGMRDEVARTLRLLGNYEIVQGNRHEAFHAFRAARSLCQQIDDPGGEAMVLRDYARANARLGKASEARRLLEEAALLAARAGKPKIASKVAEALKAL